MNTVSPPPPLGWSWEELMSLALKQAALGQSLEEVPVGAVIVNSAGQILSQAHNEPLALHDPSAHAEILALRKAGQFVSNYRLSDCVLVVSLEPCLMCVGAIIHARLKGVVYGAYDKQAGAVSSILHGFDLPQHNHRPWHMGGVSMDECSKILVNFFNVLR